MLTTTAREFRSDAPTSVAHTTEDLQPNESINKRQRVAPPTVLSASVKPTFPYKNFARWRHNNGGGNHYGGVGQEGGHSSRGDSWTQQALRGNKTWRGNFNARGGGRGRSSSNSSTWNHSTFRPASTPFPVATKPLMHKQQPNKAFPLRRTSHPHPRSPVAPPPMAGSLPTPSDEPLAPPLICKRSSSPQTILGRSPTPPFKRRKLDHTAATVKIEEVEPVDSSTHLESHSYAIPVTIKVEKRSPSPPPRRLVKESCSFYPLPEDCRKSNSNFKKNRQALFARENNVLKCLGLKRTKVFFRDDGMVIEWTSNTPVWSDTLRPEPSNLSSVIGEALQANSSNPSGQQKSITPRKSSSHSVDGHTLVVGDTLSRQTTWSIEPTSPPRSGQWEPKPVSSPPIPLPRRRALPIPEPRLPKANEDVPPASAPTTMTNVRNVDYEGIHPEPEQHNTSTINRDNDGAPSTSTSANITTTIKTATRAWSAEELGMVEPMAVNYLQRYIHAFDSDRSTLQSAYTEDTLFSYRMTLVSPSSSTSQSSSFISYRLPQVTSSLSSILPGYKFSLRDAAGEVHYDAVSLDGQAGGGILLTVHGALSRADANAELAGQSEYDHVVAVDHSFVLQRNGDNWKEVEDTGGTEGMEVHPHWPLVAVSHQMIVRDLDVRSGRIKFPLPITSTSLVLEHFPWLTRA